MNDTTLPFHAVFGQALGFRRNGDPIWPIQGGAPDDDKDDDKGSEDDADDSDDDDGDDDSDDADKDDTDADKDKPDDKKGFDWKRQARENEKKAKASAKKLAAVLKAAGLKDDGEMTAEQLKEKLEESGTETKGLRLENAVIKTAAKLGVDADELTDSKRFMSQLDDLIEKDLGSDEVRNEIKKLIDAEVKRRPSIKVGGGDTGKGKKGGKGGSNGSEVGGNGGKTQLTRDDLKKMSPQQIKKAQDEGRLRDLLGTTK